MITAERVSRLLSGLAVGVAGVTAMLVLSPRLLADAFAAAWILFAVALAVLGAGGAWTQRSAIVWGAALLLSGLTIAGMWSIGQFTAPAAVLLLGAAIATLWTGTPRDGLDAGPPASGSAGNAVFRSVAGVGGGIVGGTLAYEGVMVRELFGRGCANETVECALAVTNWPAVGLTLLGMAAVGVGSWLLWTQFSVRRRVVAAISR